MKTLIVVAVLSVAAFAQTAKVVVLKPEEATKAKQLHEALDSAKRAVDDFNQEIAAKYTWEKGSAISGTLHSVSPEWEYGFEFSSDYLFIVPKPYQKSAPLCYGSYVIPAAGSFN